MLILWIFLEYSLWMHMHREIKPEEILKARVIFLFSVIGWRDSLGMFTFCWVQKMEYNTQITNWSKNYLNINQYELWFLLKQFIILLYNAISDTLSYHQKSQSFTLKDSWSPTCHIEEKTHLPKLPTLSSFLEWSQELLLLTTNLVISLIVL